MKFMAETYFEYCKEASTHFEDYIEDFLWLYLREDPLATLEVLQEIGMTTSEAEKFVQSAQSETDDRKAVEMFWDVFQNCPAGTKEHRAVEDFFFDMMYNQEAGSDFYDEYHHLLVEEAERGCMNL